MAPLWMVAILLLTHKAVPIPTAWKSAHVNTPHMPLLVQLPTAELPYSWHMCRGIASWYLHLPVP